MSSQTVATVIVWQLPASLVWPVGQLRELHTKLDAATSSPEHYFGGLHTCRQTSRVWNRQTIKAHLKQWGIS